MSENKLPQRGDMVLYYPPKINYVSQQESYPAVVLDGNDTYPTLGIFAELYHIQKTVPPVGGTGIDLYGYWDWRPEKRKPNPLSHQVATNHEDYQGDRPVI